MQIVRGFLWVASATVALGAGGLAQAQSLSSTARNSIGLNLGRDALAGSFWSLELGVVDPPRLATGVPSSQGLNLSLVGSTPLGPSLSLYGKLGTNYGRTDSATLGAPGLDAAGTSLSFGAGMSYSFTPRLSATLAWDSNDMRLGASGPREAVRATSLGLRYRY
jgi:hypothetical protein